MMIKIIFIYNTKILIKISTISIFLISTIVKTDITIYNKFLVTTTTGAKNKKMIIKTLLFILQIQLLLLLFLIIIFF